MEKQKPILQIKMPDGSIRDIGFEELVLSNNLTIEALVRVLAKKNIVMPDEFLAELEQIQKERAL